MDILFNPRIQLSSLNQVSPVSQAPQVSQPTYVSQVLLKSFSISSISNIPCISNIQCFPNISRISHSTLVRVVSLLLLQLPCPNECIYTFKAAFCLSVCIKQLDNWTTGKLDSWTIGQKSQHEIFIHTLSFLTSNCFAVDDMDNYKSHLPQSPEIGKTSGSLFRIPTKVTGCIIWSGKYPQNRKVVFYLNNNQFEQSGSKLVTILYKLLQIVIDDFGKLPRNLTINLDNCWR